MVKKAELIDRSIDKWFSLAIVFLPFLYQYRGIGSTISFGEIIVAIVVIIALWRDEFKIWHTDKFLLGFYIVSVITTLVCCRLEYFKFSYSLTVFVRLVFYAFVINVARKHFNLQYVARIYCLSVLLFSIYLLLQSLFHMISGGYLPIYLRYSWLFPPEARAENLASNYRWSFRASSLFLEPGYFTFFSLPSLCLLLFKKNKKKRDVYYMIVIVAAILFSSASAGIGGLIIIFSVYFFKRADNSSSHSALLRIIVLLVSAVGVGLFFTVSETAILTVNRILNGGSSNTRIIRGFIIYAQLPPFHKVFGVGINNLEPFVKANKIVTLFDESNLNYSATIVQTLNYSGIVGLATLMLYFFHLAKRTRSLIKLSKNKKTSFDSGSMVAMLLLVGFVVCYESVMFTYRFAFLIIIFESLQRQFRNGNRRMPLPTKLNSGMVETEQTVIDNSSEIPECCT